MKIIYRYRPTIGRSTLDLPGENGEMLSQDLCEIDGWKYVSIEDGADVLASDAELELVVLDDDLRLAIKTNSPHCQLIKKRRAEMLENEFSTEDQLAMAGFSIGAVMKRHTPTERQIAAMDRYEAADRAASEWASGQYQALGL